MSVTVTVEPGPHVSIVFAGDPLPQGDREGLIPIRSERSVDQDLLEDASAGIKGAARAGYRGAPAPYTRDEKGGELIVTFTSPGTAAPRRIGRSHGTPAVTAADLASLLQIKAGDPFVEARVGLIGAAITERIAYAVSRRRRSKPNIQVLPLGRGDNARIGPSRSDSRSRKERRRSSSEWGSKAPPLSCGSAAREGAPERQAVLPPAARGRSRHAGARVSQSGIPERVGDLAAGLCQRAAQVAITWTVREGEQISRSRADQRQHAISARADSPRADDSPRRSDE